MPATFSLSKIKRSLFYFLLSAFCFLLAHNAHAASLYLDPANGVYRQGNTFSVKVRVDTQEECINALNVTLAYPKDKIKAVDVARGESILTLWTEDPVIDQQNGTIHFSGGLPGGYCGRVKGDPGFTNVIAEVIFQVPGLTVGEGDDSNSGKITFEDDTAVLLNDGLGTPAQLFVTDATFLIGPPTAEGVENKWFDIVRNDDIRPEPFSVQLLRDDSVYGGKWFIAFSTLDKQSGLDHYEVYETDIDREGYVRGTRKDETSEWKEAKSPYLLEDQSLNSIIRVRAIDKAGNERIAGKIPEESLRQTTKEPINKTLFFVVGGILLILLIIAAIQFLRKRGKKDRVTIEESMGPPEGGTDVPPEEHQETIE